MANLLTFGEILVEMVARDVGQSALEPGAWIGPYPSGAPAILAHQAALCGSNVRMVGSVGADAFGEVCVSRLEADGVDTSDVRVIDAKPTGVAFVRYARDGGRTFIFHLADSASGQFHKGAETISLRGVDCVHVMGSSAFSLAAVNALVTVVSRAKEIGIKVSFDPNIRKEMLRDPRFVDALKWVLNNADYVLASEGELPLLMDGTSDRACARQLISKSAGIVVLKRGDRGAALLLQDDTVTEVPGFPVDEVDPTGAGDCFGGTFLSLILQGYGPQEALGYANLAGALAVTQRGPMSGNRPLEDLKRIHTLS